jgi:multiple sugar transport system permease protein
VINLFIYEEAFRSLRFAESSAMAIIVLVLTMILTALFLAGRGGSRERVERGAGHGGRRRGAPSRGDRAAGANLGRRFRLRAVPVPDLLDGDDLFQDAARHLHDAAEAHFHADDRDLCQLHLARRGARRMLNTVIVAFGAGAISIVAGAMAGYALARLPLRGASTIGTIILLSRGVPPIALAVPMFLVARKLGLSDKHITLILAYCTFLIPYVMWLMRGFFKALPPELEESAMLDGCTRFGAFLRIIVPISMPGILSTLIFSVILAWEELLFALVLTNRDATTIPVAIAGIAGDTVNGANWGALTAVGTLTVIPVVVFAMLVQKWLIQGLADGATKG